MVKFKGVKDSPGSPPLSLSSADLAVAKRQTTGTLIRHEVVSSCVAVIIECVRHQVFLTQSCETKEGVKQTWLPFTLTTDHDDLGWKERANELVRKTLSLDTDEADDDGQAGFDNIQQPYDNQHHFTDPFVLQVLHRSLDEGSKRWTYRVLFYTAIHSKVSSEKLRASKESIQSINSQASCTSSQSTTSSLSDDEETHGVCFCQRVPINPNNDGRSSRDSSRSRDGPQRTAASRKSANERSKDAQVFKWKPSVNLTQKFVDEPNLWGRVLKSKYKWSVDTIAPQIKLSDKVIYSKLHYNNPFMRLIEFHTCSQSNSKSKCTLAMFKGNSDPNQDVIDSKSTAKRDQTDNNLLVLGAIVPVYSSDNADGIRFGPASIDSANGGSLNGHTCIRKVTEYSLSNHEIVIRAKDGSMTEAFELDPDDFGTCRRSRDQSLEARNAKSGVRILINLINEHAKHITSTSKLPTLFVPRSEWFNSSDKIWLKDTVNLMKDVVKRAKDVFMKEPRVLDVPSPVVVFGDIHGNLPDLIRYQNHFWNKDFPTRSNGSNYLFLGDYVDRGASGVEVVIYLFCMKILAPNKMFLIRGNHEHRQLQINFSFKREVMNKFKCLGDEGAHDMWNLINDTFDTMPVAGIIDGSIFTAHGGIPTSDDKISELQKMPKVLKDPEMESASAWEMLWNDPLSRKGAAPLLKALSGTKLNAAEAEDKRRGFLFNEKRGTAFYFLEKSVDIFFNLNNLSHMIRAHEVIQEGFKFHFHGKCTTVFSSSKYQGGGNRAACIIVADELIRPVSIET